jgi:hypothetical protein
MAIGFEHQLSCCSSLVMSSFQAAEHMQLRTRQLELELAFPTLHWAHSENANTEMFCTCSWHDATMKYEANKQP